MDKKSAGNKNGRRIFVPSTFLVQNQRLPSVDFCFGQRLPASKRELVGLIRIAYAYA